MFHIISYVQSLIQWPACFHRITSYISTWWSVEQCPPTSVNLFFTYWVSCLTCGSDKQHTHTPPEMSANVTVFLEWSQIYGLKSQYNPSDYFTKEEPQHTALTNHKHREVSGLTFLNRYANVDFTASRLSSVWVGINAGLMFAVSHPNLPFDICWGRFLFSVFIYYSSLFWAKPAEIQMAFGGKMSSKWT